MRKTTEPRQHLPEAEGAVGIEVDVEQLRQAHEHPLNDSLRRAAAAHARGLTATVCTRRTEKTFADQQVRLAFGEAVSALLMDVVRGLPDILGFLISKGGITSHDVLSDGLALTTARVLRQRLPGCSVVRCLVDHPRFPDLPAVFFPDGLATVYRRLAPPAPQRSDDSSAVQHAARQIGGISDVAQQQ